MRLKVFTVFDSKVGAYLPPQYARSSGEMVRSFETACNDKSHDFGKYSTDYTLFEIGEYDDEDGVVKMYDAKISLGLAKEFVQAVN